MASNKFLADYGSPYTPSEPAAPTAPSSFLPPGTTPGVGGFGGFANIISGALKDPANANLSADLTLPQNFTSRYSIPTTDNGHVDYSQLPTSPPPSLPDLPIFSGGGGSSFNGSNDPNVLNALGLEQQGLGQLDAALRSAREKAIIGFGDPSLAQEAGFGLDPQAGAFARQNYLSGNATLSRIDKAHELARKAVINRLVSHGLLQSGDLGYGEGQADQQYGNETYDAKQQLLDYLSSLFNSYTEKQQALRQATVQSRLNALNAFTANPDAYSQYYSG